MLDTQKFDSIFLREAISNSCEMQRPYYLQEEGQIRCKLFVFYFRMGPCISLRISIKFSKFSSQIKGTCRSSRGVCDSAIGGLGRTADVPLLIMLHKASTQPGMFILTKKLIFSLIPHICVSFLFL